MPVQVTAPINLVGYLSSGWTIKGHTQGLGYQFTNPASPNPSAYGGWWASHVTGTPYLAGFVLFFWIDFNPPVGGYSHPPWVRETWIEKTYTEAQLNAALGIAVAVGQEIGFRFQSILSLAGGYSVTPAPFIEIATPEGELERFAPTGSWDLWTLPPGGHPNIQDSYLAVPLGASKSITVRIGAQNLAPSLNLVWRITSGEIAAFAASPPPPGPQPITPCSIYDILYRAQEETGHLWNSWESASQHLIRYAKRLLSRCMASWYGNEVSDESPLLLSALLPTFGWGVDWGASWGGGTSYSIGLAIGASYEAIWKVEARRQSNQQWEEVYLVKPDDRITPNPRCLIRDGQVELVDFASVWFGVYDQLRLIGTNVHPTPGDWDTSLAPNEHIGPLFCRTCELEMARMLAAVSRDVRQALYLAEERDSVSTQLMNQGRSQGHLESLRHARR